MSNVLKNYIFRKIENLIDDFVADLYKEFDIKTGDIEPMQALFLENIEKKLTSLICALMEQNCHENFQDTWEYEDVTSSVKIETLLRGFLQKEVEYRLKEWFELPEAQVTSALIKDVTDALDKRYDDVVNVDMMDRIISETLQEKNVQY